ncbi:hypothetical protein D9611_005369 [Ephemerocybe angulata]|uniref:NACHT domain-containing protein n=1 Tax=Ephemerocybe angulata TaxID=980116 RepID=A0A8H5FDF7_9AGAR|nr:hypothetical protein D9611_005369 [Tulosesus angulatus]
MEPNLQAASTGRMDVDQGPGGPQFFSGASNITARDLTVQNAGRDMINNIIVNPAPISSSIEEVTAWLKGANFRAIYRVSLETRIDDTGTWFIATFEFGEFMRRKGTVVWATGLPGSGKTILASISIEHLEDRFSGQADVAIVYAFLRYSERPTLLQIIAGLLTQLVRCHPAVLFHLLPTYLRAKMHHDELSFPDAVKLLEDSLGLFSDAFIVIDGLDEVDDTTKDGLLRVLTPLNVHILFTCRPLELFMDRHTPSALQIPVQAQTQDIEIYVAERIKESTTLASILSAHPNVAERFTALIKEKSKGMFLLARLQMELVLERCVTIGSLLKALETLPSGINDMYHITMDRISSLSEEKVSIAHRVFLWVLHAKEDLTPKDLQHALMFSYQDKTFVTDNLVPVPVLLSICCGLVTVEERKPEKDVVRFIHYSAQEFMKCFAFSHLPDPHDLLAVTSVACVETHLSILKAEQKSKEGFAVSPGRLPPSRRIPPFLHYALHHWGHHSKICDDQHSLNPFIQSFLSKQRTYIFVDHCEQLFEVSSGLGLATICDLVNLISSRTIPYSPTHCTETPFHIAARYGHTAALYALLKNYSGVHVSDEAGRTPLHHCVLAVSTWQPQITQQLLNISPSDTWRAYPSEVVDINAQDKRGRSAFFEACTQVADSWRFEIIRRRILHLFTSHPHVDVDLPDSIGGTPISYVLRAEQDDVAQFLIASVPTLKVDTRNNWEETPFMHACDMLSDTVVEWFLSRAPSGRHLLHQEDDEGMTTLERILAYEGFASVRNREGRSNFNLREYQLDVGWTTDDHEQVDKIIEILSRHGSSVRMVRNGHESLPLYQLRSSGTKQSPTVHVTLDDGHRRYEDGRTSLMLLVNYPNAVKYLVSKYKDNPDFINAQDTDGRSALMYVGFRRDSDTAELSVEHITSCPSVDIHLRDRDGMSALDYAVYSENIVVLDVLLNHPSWDLPAIRTAVITAAHNRNITRGALEHLLNAGWVQDAFSDVGHGKADGCALITALRRRADCKDILETCEDDCVFKDPSYGLFWDEEEEEDGYEDHPSATGTIHRTPAAIRRSTIAAVKSPFTSAEQLESHFGQTVVKDAFVWNIDVRDPDTVLLINCLARRSDCYDLFHNLFGGFKRCEGSRHQACVHALIRF